MINNTYFSSNLKMSTSPPMDMRYFFEGDFNHLITLSDSKDDIDTITSTIAFIDIIDYKLQKYSRGRAYSGKYLADNKLIIELQISKQLKYISKNIKLTSSILNIDNVTQIISIAVPNKICNIPIEDIIRRGELNISSYIENIFFKKIDSRTALTSISAVINVKF
ncbi:MAG: hypothetical protein ACRC6T_09205 [Sarcina sp.]